jgi:hypothetical protein
MTTVRVATRNIPLANPLGRQLRQRGTVRDWLLSAALHAAVVAFIILAGTTFEEVLGPPGIGPGRGGGGGGGGDRTFVLALPAGMFAAPPPPPQLVLPSQLSIQVPVIKVPEAEVHAPTAAELAAQAVTGAGPGQGEGKGTGTGPGSGSGTGGGIGSGTGPGVGSDSGGMGRIFPPQPQGIILPPTGRPAALAGVRLTVRFEISERGEVVGVEVDPPIRDRAYRNEFMDRMRHYTFTPASTLDGRPVRAIFPVQITL